MLCKYCGNQNSVGARYCSGCGRELGQKKGTAGRILGIAVVCLLVVGIGIWSLFANLAGGEKKTGAAEIAQVIPMDDGSVAVLYADGTVKVSGNADFSATVSDWMNVTQLFYNQSAVWKDGEYQDNSSLMGLTEEGAVLSTAENFPEWRNVKELHFSWQGTVGVTKDGNVLTEGTWYDEAVRLDLAGMSDVETLVFSSVQGVWGCLKKDGSVHLISEFTDPDEICWTNVEELRDSGHAFYVIKKDGTIDGGLMDSYAGLANAVKIVHYNDWIFGIHADGRLLTHNGGNIYTNIGAMMVDVPGVPYYSGEVDISQYNQIKDIMVFEGLILLNRDGTVDTIGENPNWDLSGWTGIRKVCGTSVRGWENRTLYGIRQDGSVIMTRYDWDQMTQSTTDSYCGWKLQDIYDGEGGVVGLTVDGNLVGDGIYADLDF